MHVIFKIKSSSSNVTMIILIIHVNVTSIIEIQKEKIKWTTCKINSICSFFFWFLSKKERHIPTSVMLCNHGLNWMFYHMFLYVKQEAHGPHHSPEKTLEKKIFKSFVNVFPLFRNYLPLEKDRIQGCFVPSLVEISTRMLCAKFGWK